MFDIMNISQVDIVEYYDELMHYDSKYINIIELAWKCFPIKLIIPKKVRNRKSGDCYE